MSDDIIESLEPSPDGPAFPTLAEVNETHERQMADLIVATKGEVKEAQRQIGTFLGTIDPLLFPLSTPPPESEPDYSMIEETPLAVRVQGLRQCDRVALMPGTPLASIILAKRRWAKKPSPEEEAEEKTRTDEIHKRNVEKLISWQSPRK